MKRVSSGFISRTSDWYDFDCKVKFHEVISTENNAANNERYLMGVEYFPLSMVSALVFTWLFTDITYDSIHSSNDTILKSESHWTGFKFIQPLLWLSFANRLIWRIILGRMIPIQIDDDDQSHNWSNQPRSDEDPAATVIQDIFNSRPLKSSLYVKS